MTQSGTNINETTKDQGINRFFFITYMVALSAFGSFVNDMYLPSLPSMVHFFHCSVPVVQLGLTMGMAGLAIGELILGPMSDKYGRKPILLWSMVLFLIAAVVSIFSKNIHFFLVCRFFQGVGASTAYFLARTIPTDVYRGGALARTLAIIGAINGFAPASAPVLGSLISSRWTWKGVFVSLSIISIVILIMYPWLKETLPLDRRDKGSLWHSYTAYGSLIKNKHFMIHTMLKGSALGLLFAYISSAPFIIQTHYGYSQIDFGLFMGGNATMVVIGSLLALKFKPLKNAASVGAAIVSVFTILQGLQLIFVDKFIAYELLMLPIIFGLGMIFTVSNTLAMNEGRANAGGASAILGLMGYVFGAIVSPLVGMGDMMHSTACVFFSLTAIIIFVAILAHRISPDLNR